MSTNSEGTQYIRNLSSFVRKNEAVLFPSNLSQVPNKDNSNTSSTHNTTSSAFDYSFGLGNLLPLSAKQNSTELNSESVSPYTFSPDPHHLAFLLNSFESCPLVLNYIKTGVESVKEGISGTPSTAPTSPPNSTAPTWFGWSGVSPDPNTTPQHYDTTIDEDLLHLYKFLRRVRVLKLAPVGEKRIGGVSYGGDAIVSLQPFEMLNSLELYKVFPATVTDWSVIREKITSLVCQHSIKSLDELIGSLNGIRQSDALRSYTFTPPESLTNFPLLTRLDLSNNSLVNISTSEISNFINCISLDLSSNLFTNIPSAINLLEHLKNLNMSGNNISSLSNPGKSLDVMQLSNVTTLVLQKNNLENLIGIERFFKLKSIDISENKIADVFEIARLASLPDIEELKVAKNPLTKLINYRTNIFTYFKSRALMLTLDGSLPTADEKKTVRALTVSSDSPRIPRLLSETSNLSLSDTSPVVVKGRRRKPKHEKNKLSIDDASSSGSSEPSRHDHKPRSSVELSPGLRRHRLAGLEQVITESSASLNFDATNIENNVVLKKSSEKPRSRSRNKYGSPSKHDPENAETLFNKWKERAIENKSSTSPKISTIPMEKVSSKSSELSEFPRLQPESPSETELAPATRLKVALAKLREQDSLTKSELIPSINVINALPSPVEDPSTFATLHNAVTGHSIVEPEVPIASQPTQQHISTQQEKPVKIPSKPASTTGSVSSVSHLGGIGHYRRIYEYNSRNHHGAHNSNEKKMPVQTQTPTGKESPESPVNSLPLSEKRDENQSAFTSNVLAASYKPRRISSPDVEVGTSEEFNVGKISGNRPKQTNIKPLPPLTLSNNSQTRNSTNLLGSFMTQRTQPKTNIPAPPKDTVRPVGTASNFSGETGTTAKSGNRAPSLILSRPIAYSHSYTSRASNSTGTVGNTTIQSRDSAESVSSGRSAHSFAVSYNGQMARGFISASSTYARSVGGRTMTGSTVSGTAHRVNGDMEMLLPRAPSIPFLTMTNSLQLYLKFQVFESDEEKILCWIPGSFIAQLPPYMAEEDDGWSKTSLNQGNWFTRSFASKPEKPPGSKHESGEAGAFPSLSAAELLDSVEPLERPGFFLLTDKNLYIFTPNFGFPYDSKESHDPYAQYINSTMKNIRYDDPTKFLSLLYIIPFTGIGRLDLGPNRQYLAVHFLRDKSRANAPDVPSQPNTTQTTDATTMAAKTSNNMLNLSWYTGNHTQTPFVSLVLLTRDKEYTSRLIDHLTPILYDIGNQDSTTSSSHHITGPNGRVRIINQDVEWAVRSLQENILLKLGKKNIVYNRISNLWKGKLTSSTGIRHTKSSSNLADGIKSGLNWIGGLLATGNSGTTTPVTVPTPLDSKANSTESISEPKLVEVEPAKPLFEPIIKEADEDMAVHTTEEISKVDFEFLKLYLLVGWVFPASGAGTLDSTALNQLLPSPQYGSPNIRPCSLIATKEFLYLTNERFDVWPPLLFPPEFEPTAHVNETIENAGSRSQPGWSSNHTAFKGLVADLVTPFSSPPLIVGKIADIKRCERWRSWRYTMQKEVQQIGAEPDENGLMIMNGAIGFCKSKTSIPKDDRLQVEDALVPPHSDLSVRRGSVGTRRLPSSDSWRSSLFRRKNVDPGNAAGWGWWIRIVFSKPVFAENPSDQSTPDSNRKDGTEEEYWWDIVFSTMDSANEFLEYIRDVRGVKPSDGDEESEISEHEYPASPTAGALSSSPEQVVDDDGEEHRDRRLFGKPRKDGVVLIIGDD
ncbi:hypothetical protein HK098_000083 [Nowakowskiella sp. JEL0407]|nr:hypothetical protein HK098_000083 [Nowakowskiella sp. JEL0407]